jgi:hypothetical protein
MTFPYQELVAEHEHSLQHDAEVSHAASLVCRRSGWTVVARWPARPVAGLLAWMRRGQIGPADTPSAGVARWEMFWEDRRNEARSCAPTPHCL